MSTRVFAVVNPAAGGGRSGRTWSHLRELFVGSGLRLDWAATTRPGEGVELARRADAEGHDVVIAVGGDGAVNEVVNGVTADDGTPQASDVRAQERCRTFWRSWKRRRPDQLRRVPARGTKDSSRLTCEEARRE